MAITTELPRTWKPLFSGKVRDIYEITGTNYLALVASDRLSAFDWVLPNEVPDKGKILTQIAKYWFSRLAGLLPHHWDQEAEWKETPKHLLARTMVVRRVQIFPFEFIVRGYLAGSAWKSYRASGRVGSDHLLGPGLRLGDPLMTPLLTVTTKASGPGAHDEDIPWSNVEDHLGRDRAMKIREAILAIFQEAGRHLAERNIVLVDTKFELGQDTDGRIVLADEVLTPDSSRFWWRQGWERYQKDAARQVELPALDKQLVRDYLEKTIQWNKQPPLPILPEHLIDQTRTTYLELFHAVTGSDPIL